MAYAEWKTSMFGIVAYIYPMYDSKVYNTIPVLWMVWALVVWDRPNLYTWGFKLDQPLEVFEV